MKQFKPGLGTKIRMGFGILIVIMLIMGGIITHNMRGVVAESVILDQEYVHLIKVFNKMEQSLQRAMLNMRGYGLSGEKQYFEEGIKAFEKVKTYVTDAKHLIAESPHIKALEETVSNIEIQLLAYEKHINETVTRYEQIEKDRKTLDNSAMKYMDNCYLFLRTQTDILEAEMAAGLDPERLSERLKKITLVNEVIHLGHITRIANFKSYAVHNLELIRDAQKNFDLIESKLDTLLSFTRLNKNIEEINATRSASLVYKDAMNNLLTNWLAIDELGRQRLATGDKILNSARDITAEGISETEKVAEGIIYSVSSAFAIMIIGFIVAVIVSIGIGFFITFRITKSLNNVVEGLTKGSEQLASASEQISSSSQCLAEGTSEQAASIEEISATMEEISSMTQRNAEHVSQTDKLMKEVIEIVDKAGKSMKELIQSMEEITGASEESFRIIKTIDEIAFQTNLLSLNAATEAARAGKAGTGFAVVANEVRNLALRSAQAAKNTSALIEDIVKKIHIGAEVVNRTSADFSNISASADKVGNLLTDIAAASKDQAQGIEQMTRGGYEMDRITQQNAANAEQLASTSEELSSQAALLRNFVNEVMILIKGKSVYRKGKRNK